METWPKPQEVPTRTRAKFWTSSVPGPNLIFEIISIENLTKIVEVPKMKLGLGLNQVFRV